MKYKKQKGLRIKNSRFFWANIKTPPDGDGFWVIEYEDNSKEWRSNSEIWNESTGRMNPEINKKLVRSASSNFGPIRSIRAFRRRLKEWRNTLPKGTEVILTHRYIGYCVYGKIK